MVSLGSRDSDIVAALRAEFPHARITRDEGDLAHEVGAIVAHLEGREPHADLALDVRATAFQWRMWDSLRTIPPGETRSYGALARAIGRPQAARAVGRACATNPVSLIVPCHRAVGADGKLTGYRWGVERKKALLEGERARAASPARRGMRRPPQS